MIKARAMRRRHRGRRSLSQGAVAVHLAQIHGFRRGRRHPRDEAADPRLQGTWRNRGRGLQHQARPRRHPRDRIFRADAAIDRRAAGIRNCAGAGRWQRSARSPRADGSAARRGTIWKRPICFCARSSTGLQMVADEQTHILPASAAGIERFAQFLRFCRPDGIRGRPRRAAAEGSRPLFGPVRAIGRFAATQSDFPERLRRPRDARSPRGARLPKPAGNLRDHPRLGGRPLSGLARRIRPQPVDGFRSASARSIGEERKSRSWLLSRSIVFCPGLHPGGGGRLLLTAAAKSGAAGRWSGSFSATRRDWPIFSREHPQAMDALIDPAFFAATPDAERLAQALSRALDQANSYEDFLDRLRLFGQEQIFLIGARILSGTLSAELAGKAYARLADVIIRALASGGRGPVCRRRMAASGAQKTALLAHGQTRRRGDDGRVRSRPHPGLRFRRRTSGVRRRAVALWRPVFRAADAAADQRADRADELRRALSGRYAVASLRALRPGRDPDRCVRATISKTKPGPGSIWR